MCGYVGQVDQEGEMLIICMIGPICLKDSWCGLGNTDIKVVCVCVYVICSVQYHMLGKAVE